MFEKIEELVLQLRKVTYCHICQKISFETEYNKAIGEKKQLIEFNKNVRLTMWEFVDRTKFEDYKLVIEIEYSSDDDEEILKNVFERLSALSEIYK